MLPPGICRLVHVHSAPLSDGRAALLYSDASCGWQSHGAGMGQHCWTLLTLARDGFDVRRRRPATTWIFFGGSPKSFLSCGFLLWAAAAHVLVVSPGESAAPAPQPCTARKSPLPKGQKGCPPQLCLCYYWLVLHLFVTAVTNKRLANDLVLLRCRGRLIKMKRDVTLSSKWQRWTNPLLLSSLSQGRFKDYLKVTQISTRLFPRVPRITFYSDYPALKPIGEMLLLFQTV